MYVILGAWGNVRLRLLGIRDMSSREKYVFEILGLGDYVNLGKIRLHAPGNGGGGMSCGEYYVYMILGVGVYVMWGYVCLMDGYISTWSSSPCQLDLHLRYTQGGLFDGYKSKSSRRQQ